AAAAAGSAVSTWATKRALDGRWERLPLWPLALYRAALAASVSAMPTAEPLTNRVIAITGAARGIGFATARELQRRGAKVAIGDVVGHEEAGAKLGVPAFACDVTDRASFSAFLDGVEERLGPLDVLINNAGIAPLGTFADEDDAVTRKILEVDLFGVALGSKLAIARMRPRGRGRIVNIASAAARFGTSGLVTYSAAKHGVLGLTETLRFELDGTGIETTVVLPGPVETDMIAGTRRTKKLQVIEPEDAAKAIADGIARGAREIWVPKVNSALHRLTTPLGGRVQQRLMRLLETDRMYTEVDEARRTEIEERMRAGV
ncbi:MAG TPA: SDR family oxidoreductase, partial [Solirubrobacteraceae bacterium]|nr:SDR family oxidoreductase [Solirubrobacteraceae bacterium]